MTDRWWEKDIPKAGGDAPTAGGTDDQWWKKDKPAEQAAGTPWYGQIGRGLARGVAGLATSVEDIMPSTGILGGALPGLPEDVVKTRQQASGELRKFANAPAEGPLESGGRLVGQIAPTLLIPGIGATSALGSLAERAAIGGIAGGLQPTEAGTAASHIPGAVGGAATAGMLRGATELGGLALQQLSKVGGRGVVGRGMRHVFLTSPLAGIIHKTTGLGWAYSLPIAAAMVEGGMSYGAARRAFGPGAGAGRQTTAGAAIGRLAGGAAGAIAGGGNGQEPRQAPRSTPAQADRQTTGRSGDGRNRNNFPTAAERFDRRWSALGDLQSAQSEERETR